MFFNKKNNSELTLNHDIAHVIKKSVENVFSTMFNIKAKSEEHSIETHHKNLGDISGVISMFEENANATLVLSMPKETAISLMNQLYQTEVNEASQECIDGIGEITNMIYGSFKSGLEDTGLDLKMAIPKVILGCQHMVIHDMNCETLVLPFKIPMGRFEVTITSQKAMQKAG